MSELREALTAAGAPALIAKVIDPTLLEYQRRYAPLVRAVPMQPWSSDIYYFNQRTAVAAGGFVPDGGARPVANSTYVQLQYKMAHIESVGAVTGYAQEVTAAVIGDLRRTEISGAIQGYYWDVEAALLWGNAASTANQAQPQFDGLDSLVNDFTSGYKNSIDKNSATFALAMLDELIDMVETNAAMPIFNDTWMFVMSNTAVSKIAQLLVSQQRYEQVEVAVGLIVPSYRNIPLVKTSFLSSRGFGMGTVTSATATTGGSLPASSTYKYFVSPVISRQGETLPSNEVTQATGAGTATNTITLSFAPPAGLDSLAPILYKVYRTAADGAANSETFLGYVDSTVGLAGDGVTPIITNQIVDTGTALVPQNSTGPIVPAVLPGQYFGTNANMFPAAAGVENMYLISRDRNNVCRPYVREARPLDVYPTTASPDSLPYAVIGDCTLAVRAQRYVGRMSRVGVSV
ncbi:MAG TPA: hypothetical protein VFQ44_01945 [Streptosporangiaceae bacterium]|nr:hypothetical protein [Streptosporangiaceae bacterium]